MDIGTAPYLLDGLRSGPLLWGDWPEPFPV